MVTHNLCPVCGYQMEEPPEHFNICPSCGTEFGVHDQNSSPAELRNSWIRSGLQWWSNTEPKPMGWNPFVQLANLGLSSGPVVTTTTVEISPSWFNWGSPGWNPQSASTLSALERR